MVPNICLRQAFTSMGSARTARSCAEFAGTAAHPLPPNALARLGVGLAPTEARVAQLLLAFDVPIFQGLNARVVAAVHDDDNFG
ncbi:hypothetical protein GCM10012284_11790 [Mangrovihabitans endophyticus]|uniref:Uncharacterized protein n=1 Tax=Mangrovihabitans endophyticus TaxID=1751298 RepID=A0A8J3FLY7_9ACTN|nr:hypothetical protein GCM10012284_11790 [Mangrovihabitans endophyticus]